LSAIANDSRFGLDASAWTDDDGERDRFIDELESGMVFINKMVASDPRIPFGGSSNPAMVASWPPTASASS
jgi:succinate-semialdehyde dehydrogenase/glutarate-semialdehyde dehydrogenase